MKTDRYDEIAVLVASSQRMMTPERAFALLKACEELLRVVPRQSQLL